MSAAANPSPEEGTRPFKEFIDRDVIRELATRLEGTGRPFRRQLFTRRAGTELDDLELKQRVRQVAAALRAALDDDVEAALETLVRALPPELDDHQKVTNHFGYWPFLQFVEDFAAKPEHFDAAMGAIYEMTQRFSAEFAIRPLLDAEPERTLEVLRRWTADPSWHVRRLCSEGTRPRLPWGMRLQRFVDDPAPNIPLLEALVDDPVEAVRRSVANHVNDIAKDHPQVAIDLCRRWWDERPARGDRKTRERLVRHALRTLVKAGDADALELLGYRAPRLDAQLHVEPKAVRLGDAVRLRLSLVSTATEAQPLLIDYAVHFKKADGTLRPKVFKWTQTVLDPEQTLELEKRHVFREVTTRTHYPGTHRIEALVNGESAGSVELELRDP